MRPPSARSSGGYDRRHRSSTLAVCPRERRPPPNCRRSPGVGRGRRTETHRGRRLRFRSLSVAGGRSTRPGPRRRRDSRPSTAVPAGPVTNPTSHAPRHRWQTRVLNRTPSIWTGVNSNWCSHSTAGIVTRMAYPFNSSEHCISCRDASGRPPRPNIRWSQADTPYTRSVGSAIAAATGPGAPIHAEHLPPGRGSAAGQVRRRRVPRTIPSTLATSHARKRAKRRRRGSSGSPAPLAPQPTPVGPNR